MGELTDAERDYQEALNLLKPLAAEAPENRDYLRDLAYVHHGLGVLRKRSTRLQDAERNLDEAMRIEKTILAAAPDSLPDREALAESRYRRGTVLARLARRSKEQEDAYREAIAAQSATWPQHRNQTHLRGRLGRYLNNFAKLLELSHRDEAEKIFRENIELQQTLHKESPGLPPPRWQLARSLNN